MSGATHSPAMQAGILSRDTPAPRAAVLNCDSAAELASSLMLREPGVFVVGTSDASLLLAHPELIHDGGSKHPAVQLSRALRPAGSGVPLVRAKYANAGKLRQGVSSFLRHAGEQRWAGPWIVAVAPRLLAQLLAQTTPPASESPPAPAPEQQLLESLPAERIPAELSRERFLGDSPSSRLVRHLIMRMARSDVRVLIVGPTGCGKEVVARAIHDFGPRREQPFRAINCSAVPADLFEAELFGHVRGAFTGAQHANPGLWASAGEGTLFLDEVSEMRPDHQAKLLRALESHKVRAVGATTERHVRARVIAATNRTLDSLVRAGRFRSDLYYRIRGLLLRVPPLREHVEDIPKLAQFYWRRIVHKQRAGAVLTPPVLARLCACDWPGNVRQLQLVLETLWALYENPVPTVEQLHASLLSDGQSSSSIAVDGDDEIERHRIDCLRHLKRADEVLRACEAMLAPLLRQAAPSSAEVDVAQATLHHRLQELELLCMHRALFWGESTYLDVHGAKNRLQALHAVIGKDVGAAVRRWREEVTPEMVRARRAIFDEIGRVVERGGRSRLDS